MIEYKMCPHCVMDTKSDPSIVFESNGKCERCNMYENTIEESWNHGYNHEIELQSLIMKIKKEGKGKKYDCLVGLSGGFDSTYVLHEAVTQWGVRPLVFHVDSGLDLPLGVQNVNAICNKLGVDLRVAKIDQEDMRNFQLAMFRTGMACLDIPQDHAFVQMVEQYAVDNGIKYILNGENISTEAYTNPAYWHTKFGGGTTDTVFINDVLRKHSPAPLKHYKFTNTYRRKIWLPLIKGIKVVKPLNLIPYNYKEIKKILFDEYGYIAYPQKHFESLITKFLEGWWYPKRFGYDVRNHQLSSLVVTGQMTREEAIACLAKPSVSEEEGCEMFKQVANYLRISEEELQLYFDMPLGKYQDYKHGNIWPINLGIKIMFLLGKEKRVRK
ncbi:N-acetyl sugar amidotransferase [Bacteroides eggerthii]|uniref:N-acetyl sugar amidotransferase n=1 Tax=Bacteroides eggerthii TaxID=28111 RepID=UPI001C22D7D9|nr:N-acetyl sugar amidotransferase [Bacteroides eggerthii]MBU8974418.1 N-acetyl sugar amidotransferase [Bacteroides eggerthii]MBU8999181.1 N-acetyl sugar amidotransferase [Bacteroides eggerthii]MCG4760659.1 N-acetyl sugar amidotransferase [Bacteroides eggerthii]